MATSNDYQQGYLDAHAQIRADLANILRINAVDTGEDNAEVISDRMVRDIFSGVFGVRATDDEFGPEPGLNAEISRALLKVRGKAGRQ